MLVRSPLSEARTIKTSLRVFCYGLFAAVVWVATASPDLFAQTAASGYPETTLVYDTGRDTDELFGYRRNASLAQRYDVPAGARLTAVLAAPLFEDQFQVTLVPGSSPRDFRVRIWDVGVDGLPGAELYGMEVDGAGRFNTTDKTYTFMQVDFPEGEDALANLPDQIFIGLANTGTDFNDLLVATSPRKDTAPADASYLYGTLDADTRWRALSSLTVDAATLTVGTAAGMGMRSLRDRVFPIRPVFHTPSDNAFEETILSYDSGRNDDRIVREGDGETAMAQRYAVPPGSRLASVSVAPIYDNQFLSSAAPVGAARDFTLKVWEVGAGDSPGAELYSMVVGEDPYASHRLVDGVYLFSHVDLPAEEPILSSLPDRVFIGLANAGSDRNYLVLSTSRRKSGAPVDAAYLYADSNAGRQWLPLSNIFTGINDRSLGDQAFPVRPRFLAGSGVVSAEDAPELPSAAELAQNYPNPFNPATSISWTQPAAGRVRLSAYDLLGRQAGVLADGLHPAGRHEVRLDASGWPSGAYVYVLETETRVLTRRMVLLK